MHLVMKLKRQITKILFLLVYFGMTNSLYAQAQSNDFDKFLSQRQVDFDKDWRFRQGDSALYKSGDFDDAGWRKLNLPHDWSIEGEYKEDHPGGRAMGFLPGGIGWYRKTFRYDKEWQNKRINVAFDGVYMKSEVWINGRRLGFHPNGYTGFQYDVTPYLRRGENVIAVRVDNANVPSGRWYTGSGIYRHVKLMVTHPVHVARHGTQTITELKNGKAEVHINTTINSAQKDNPELKLVSMIADKEGQIVAEKSAPVNAAGVISQTAVIENPRLWSPETPDVYYLYSILKKGDETLDVYKTRFGVRSIEFSAEYGFKLNGKKTLLKGVANHQDAGPVGVAVPIDTWYWKLKKLKEMGCNAIRTAHHPFAPEFYAMCDTMGFMVMNDAFDGWDKAKAEWDYGHFFNDHWKSDMKEFISRDRNHPSVVIWCIGNEVPKYSREVQQELADYFREQDPTRPITQAHTYTSALDIAGFNGNGEEKNVLINFNKNNSGVPAVGTEMTHTLQTRGVYRTRTHYRKRDNPAPWESAEEWPKFKAKVHLMPDLNSDEVFTEYNERYASGYDNHIVRINVREEWKHVRDFDFLMGDFRWTGFDYLGESFGWPARTDNFGVIDLAGFPKDHFYLYQSLWSDQPMAHITPHWTHPGKEGVSIPVVVYTNCDEAELFLNGRSLGRQTMTDELQIVWNVPYEPGELKAVAYKDGREMAVEVQRTAGEAAQIRGFSDKDAVITNETDVAHISWEITDASGNAVPDADHLLKFEVEGPGKIIGVENGDILDISPNKADNRKAFKGKCLLMIQATGKSGDIIIRAHADGLQNGLIKIKSENQMKNR